MAKHAAAALLDELMGRHRNAAPHEQNREVRWEDPEFCKYFLVKFCPHDLFVNTRADLGACTKVHDGRDKERSSSRVKDSKERERDRDSENREWGIIAFKGRKTGFI
ncbi:luc7-like protein 3 [Diaphorina citri]|uniref:Luc7-like protein 3 n=1 Tax=Diaphorina citri TaxID=121845 RepID=A0A1S4EJ14_DIACI|nr:luc7-like protein 3 [Diaphorina citri]